MRSGAANRQKLWPGFTALLILFNGCDTNSTVVEDVFERVYTVEPDTSIRIKNRDGAVFVYGSDGDEMRVRAVKKTYSSERLSQIAIDISVRSDAVSVSTKFPSQPKWAFSDRSGTVDYTIVVPSTASISALDLNAGEVLLDSMQGPEVHARLRDGRIFARNCFTDLDLAINRGTLTLSYDWWEQRQFLAQVNVGQGSAWVFLPTDAAFHLLAHATRGKISNDFNNLPVSANSAVRELNVDQTINGGGSAAIKIRVDKGDIKIAEANP